MQRTHLTVKVRTATVQSSSSRSVAIPAVVVYVLSNGHRTLSYMSNTVDELTNCNCTVNCTMHSICTFVPYNSSDSAVQCTLYVQCTVPYMQYKVQYHSIVN